MRAIQDANGMTVYIDNEEDRITFQNADNDTVIWDEGEVPVLKRDVENVIIPRELYLRERADLRAERLIEELYKEPSNALETKLDIIMKTLADSIDLSAVREYDVESGRADTITPEKLAVIKRLIPFVEKRVNLIELAPKETGKSYVFSQLSQYGWLVSGGSISRAKMFYDINKKTQGLVSR